MRAKVCKMLDLACTIVGCRYAEKIYKTLYDTLAS